MIFEWINLGAWRTALVKDNADVLGRPFMDRYKAEGCPRIYEDDLERYRHFFSDANIDPVRIISDRARRRFTAIRAFHACAPQDVTRYFRDGIVPLDASIVQQEVRSALLSDAFPEVTIDALDRAINETSSDLRHGRLFLGLDGRTLLDCGHYLIYGSEYRIAIAATLTRILGRRDYRMAFRGNGRPTVFACNLPVEIVDDEDWDALIAKLIVVSIESRSDKSYQHLPLDFTIELDRRVEPEWIIDHQHPCQIRDPFFNTTYIWNETCCQQAPLQYPSPAAGSESGEA